MRTRHKALLTCIALSAALCAVGGSAHAQGKGKSHDDKDAAPAKRTAPAKGESAKGESAKRESAKHESAKPAERRVAKHDAPRAVRPEPARTVKVQQVKVKETKVKETKVKQVKQVKVERAKPGHGKRVVTTDRAIVVTREVLVKHGYEVVRVETVRGTRVVYYRRGNMGRGRGKGPIVRMVIRPAQERVVFESAPRGLLAEINVRLGL